MDINGCVSYLRVLREDEIFYGYFQNNGSSNINVDGSVTPIEFTLGDTVPNNFLITKIDYIMSFDEVIDITKFSNISALSNGILFSVGNQVFKNNADMLLFTTGLNIESAKITGVVASVIKGNWNLKDTFGNYLVSSRDDLKVTIRDDLSAVPFFKMVVTGIKLD